MVQALLTISLLVSFTTSASAALCLQMKHGQASSNNAGMSAAMDMTSDGTSMKACCLQQASTPEATIERLHALPIEQGAESSVPESASLVPDDRWVPPGVFDPVLEKRDHLRPSLAELSISRT